MLYSFVHHLLVLVLVLLVLVLVLLLLLLLLLLANFLFDRVSSPAKVLHL
jgi:hypothetical protein